MGLEQISIPDLDDIREARHRLGQKVLRTPVWRIESDRIKEQLGSDTEIVLKLELFQHGGSFKVRGSLMNMMALSEERLRHGVTAVSAGNHAISVAYAAKEMDTTAKVVMPKSANDARIDRCRKFGAEVVLVDDVHEAFERVKQIEDEENRSFIHPFDGELTALGTATVGLEMMDDVPDLDAVVIPIGGGGLCAGVSTAFKNFNNNCEIYGVEPEGADSMRRSFKSGKPEKIEKVDTIADSLGAPHAEEYSFRLCKEHVDELCTVTDQQLRDNIALLFNEMKLAVEPAGAATMAALTGPLQKKLRGKKVGLIVCGTNIDVDGFYEHASKGRK